jgi:hypothetical protein
MDYIQNLTMTQGEDGAKAVENYHQAMFLHEHGLELERFKQEEHIHKDRLLHLEQQLEGTRNRLSDVERLEPIENDGELDDQPTTPWNLWDRVMFALGALVILSMVVFGIMNISFNLLESGIVTFVEHPVRAYFWAALLPVGALAVKVGWDLLESDRSRANYVWATLGIGILSLLVWIGAYALVYPSLSKTTEEQIGSLTVFDSGATPSSDTTVTGVKTLDMINVIAQAISEICLSAVLGIYLTMIYQRHRPVRLAINPTFSFNSTKKGPRWKRRSQQNGCLWPLPKVSSIISRTNSQSLLPTPRHSSTRKPFVTKRTITRNTSRSLVSKTNFVPISTSWTIRLAPMARALTSNPPPNSTLPHDEAFIINHSVHPSTRDGVGMRFTAD